MLKILKDLFKTKPVIESVSFNDVDAWFSKKLKETTLSKEIAEFFDETAKTAKIFDSALLQLSLKQAAELPPEQKAVLDEHKKQTLIKLYAVQKQLAISKKRDYSTFMNYHETLSLALSQIQHASQSKALQRFFASELAQLQDVEGSLQLQQEKLKDLLQRKHGLVYIYEMRKSIHDIEQKQKLMVETQAQLERNQIEQQELESFISKLETDLDDLKTSPEYERYDTLIAKKIHIEKELGREAARFNASFKPIVRMCVLYDKNSLGADKALARQYAQDPFATFIKDKNFWITSLLNNLSAKLPELEADERRRNEFNEALSALSEQSLRDVAARSMVMNDVLEQLRKQMSSEITSLKINDVKYKMNHVKQQLKACEENREKLRAQLPELDVKKDLLSLERHLQSFAPVKLL